MAILDISNMSIKEMEKTAEFLQSEIEKAKKERWYETKHELILEPADSFGVDRVRVMSNYESYKHAKEKGFAQYLFMEIKNNDTDEKSTIGLTTGEIITLRNYFNQVLDYMEAK